MMIKSRAMVLYSNYTLESAAAAAKSLQSCPTLCDPIDSSPPGSSMGFSRQDYWNGVPLPSPLLTLGEYKSLD